MCEACIPAALVPRRPFETAGHHPATVRKQRRPHRSRRGLRAGTRTDDTHADLIITGGPILTMDPLGTRAESLAIRDGRIAAVGSAEDVAAHAGPGTETLDLDGRALLPGLVDPHMHAAMVMMADWSDLTPMSTPTADKVYAALRDATPWTNGWVFARGFDPTITRDHPHLDTDVLDRIAPDHPVFVMESNLHVGYVNSAALREVGIDRHSADPETARFVRDADGHLTGRLEETAALAPFLRRVPAPTQDDVLARHRDLLWHAASRGITLLHDCGIGLVAGTRDLDVLETVVDDASPVRYRGMLVSDRYDKWLARGIEPGWGNDRLRVEGIKAWSDGSNQGGTGFQREPYLGTEDRGSLNYSADDLAAVVERAHRDGWQVGVHANGDAAIDVTLDAFAHALGVAPRVDHRHRIEHCSVLHDDQIERMAALGVSPSFLIGHIRWWGRVFRDELLGTERANRYDPCASASAGGLRISLHSDWNVTPIEPLRYVEDAVCRIMADGGDVLNADERIPVEAALRAVTIDAAWQCRADGITGSVEVGKYADLALLDDDPTTVDPTRISQITVSQTRLGGDVRHTA